MNHNFPFSLKHMSSESIILLIITLSFFNPISCIEFIFNTNFTSTNLLTYGTATIEKSILTLTKDSTFTIGRALYSSRIQTKEPNSSTILPFSTSFIFSIAPYRNILPGHGFAFAFFPSVGLQGATSAQHLGLFNLTNDGNPSNNIFGIEFDCFMNQEFNDINDNHVGIDVNSLTSIAEHESGFWSGEKNSSKFKKLKLNNGVNYQVWIDYFDSRINVTMAKAGDPKPKVSLISEFVNLSDVFLDEMYLGFTGSTGRLAQSHRILSWSFSNTNFSIGDALITRNLPDYVLPGHSVFKSEGFIIGISVTGVMIIGIGIVIYEVLERKKRKQELKKLEMEDWELEYWPHRIEYQKLFIATKGFSEENVIGIGGNGKVYKGKLECGSEVAVKRISHQNEKGVREFLAEISSLGRLKHRNLVGLRGWCKTDKENLILVYDYMENGSLDKRIFSTNTNLTLNWQERMKILKDVAHGILYLHEGWESKVLHRDIKTSNVLLDKEMNGRLGDFGLARMHNHGQVSTTTQVVGTVGYMAPELVRTGRASTKTDVFSFGVLVLEVIYGKRPSDGLVDFVWRLMERGEVMNGIDEKLKLIGGFINEEIERAIQLGLLCAYSEANARPEMRQVVKFLDVLKEGSERDEEGLEIHLLDGIRNTRIWCRNGHNLHPTYADLSFSISLSGSNVIREGR